jgi:hypothetical protein
MHMLVKRAFRFADPRVSLIPKPGEQIKQVNFDKAFFDVQPGDVREAPEFVRNTQTFRDGVNSGDISEVIIPKRVQVPVKVEPTPETDKPKPPPSRVSRDNKLPKRR